MGRKIRRKIRRIGATILALVFVITSVQVNSFTVEASTKIKLAKKTAKIAIGKTISIKVKNLPKNAQVHYKTTKKSVAKVSKKGKVTGVQCGKANINVTIRNQGKVTNLTYKVLVKKPAISKKIKLSIGTKKKIKIKYKPKKAKYKWTSKNKKVATVKNGIISAKSLGKTKLKVRVTTSKKTFCLSSNVEVKKAQAKRTFKLGKLNSDITGAQTNIEEKAIFTIRISTSNLRLQSKDVVIYRDNKQIGYMNDKGIDGDAVKGDHIYSLRVKCISKTEAKQSYKVLCKGKSSNTVELHYFNKIGKEELKNQFEHVKEIKKIDEKYQQNGSVPKEKLQIAINAVYEQALKWKKSGDVIETSKDKNGVFIKFASGISYVYFPAQKDKDAVGSNVQVNITTCQPFKTWYATKRDAETERLDKAGTDDVASKVASVFTNYSFTKNLDNNSVTLDEVKSFKENQIILWHGHGGYQEETGSTIVTGEELDETAFLWDPIYYLENIKYTADYLSGRIMCTGYNQLAIGSAFISKYVSSMKNTFIYAAACESGQDERLANSFLDKGAVAFVGNHNSINSKYNSRMQRDTIYSLLQVKDKDGSYLTLKEAIDRAKSFNGKDDGDGAYPVIYGDETYQLSSLKEGYISGVVKAADTSNTLAKVPVYLYKDNSLITTAITDNNGNYKIKAKHNNYQIRIAQTGYKYFTSNISVVTNRTTYVENVLLVEDVNAEGTVSGTIKDALTGAKVEEVTMKFRKGWNVTVGNVVGTVKTGSNGVYNATLPVGYYTATMEKDGYVKSILNIYVSKNNSENQNGVINPTGSSSIYRAVLTWGEDPEDLDSHLVGTLSDESSFHIYFMRKTQKDEEVTVASLDVDDTTSYGPETITIIPTTDAPYSYYVYKYEGEGPIAASNAQVKLYQGNQLIKVYNVPVVGNGDYWHVFTLTNGQIQDVNIISDDAMEP